MNQKFEIIITITIEEYNSFEKIYAPSGGKYHVLPQDGYILNVFSHNDEQIVALGFMREQFY